MTLLMSLCLIRVAGLAPWLLGPRHESALLRGLAQAACMAGGRAHDAGPSAPHPPAAGLPVMAQPRKTRRACCPAAAWLPVPILHVRPLIVSVMSLLVILVIAGCGFEIQKKTKGTCSICKVCLFLHHSPLLSPQDSNSPCICLHMQGSAQLSTFTATATVKPETRLRLDIPT